MDELLREFLTETNESIDVVDAELVRFEQDPNNAGILANIFRLVHTIKGTCGFLNLSRLEALTHAAEALMGQFRDGAPVTAAAVTLILKTIDRIKSLLDALEREQSEPAGDDRDLIADLNAMASGRADPPARPRTERRSSPMIQAAPAASVPDEPHASVAAAEDTRQDSRVAQQSIRVHVNSLEHLMTMVSELVLTRNQLLEIVRRHEDSEFKTPLQRLSNVTAELQDGVMKTRMQPIGNAWQKLPRIVRDLSAELGKPIEFEMFGADTELDRQVLDLIKDPLTHMVRNSADHGLESAAQRIAAGKPDKGVIRLSARQESGQIFIEVSDDGRGLDTARIKAVALAKGHVTEAELETMSEAQVHKLIFASGFSTVTTVSNVSGRGVGMDVVRTNIDRIGGTIDVTSIKGRGTSFLIKIPLTLAIVSALIVQSGSERFAIPQLAVVELVRVRGNSEHRIEMIKDAPVLRLRNKLLPLIRLKALLGLQGDDADAKDGDFIVVAQVGSQTFGILVDAIFHTEEIVVKPMSSKLRSIAVFCGNTILGDGSVILIIDPNGLAQTVGSAAQSRSFLQDDAPAAAQVDDAAIQSMLLFRAGSPHPKAVPLALVTRLEEIDPRTIEGCNGRRTIQYRGQLMPLVLADETIRIKTEGAQPLLIFADSGRAMGLVVDEIVDIVEEPLDVQVGSTAPGLIGSAVIKGQATDIIDIAYYLPLAFEDWLLWSSAPKARASRVLLVDNSPFFRNMLTPVLRAAGYAVSAAGSVDEALAALESGRPFDVVVTDIEMPGKDGFDLAAAVRGNATTADLPVIGLSSLVSVESIERGRRVGLYDYVAKFDRPGLIAALKEQTEQLDRAA